MPDERRRQRIAPNRRRGVRDLDRQGQPIAGTQRGRVDNVQPGARSQANEIVVAGHANAPAVLRADDPQLRRARVA